MKTPAIIASLTIAGSIALAAGQRTSVIPTRPEVVREITPHLNPQTNPVDASPQLIRNDCPTAGETWFSNTVRPLDTCSQSWFTDKAIFNADVNGDGRTEYFEKIGGIILITGGSPSGQCLVVQSHLIDVGGVPVERTVCVGESVALAAYMAERFPGVTEGYAYTGGWRDMDNDQDLDLALFCYADVPGGGSFFCWLENIAFEKSAPPVAADINRDGRVDGADLGLVLFAWGPNP
jgi:hypothetical protein